MCVWHFVRRNKSLSILTSYTYTTYTKKVARAGEGSISQIQWSVSISVMVNDFLPADFQPTLLTRPNYDDDGDDFLYLYIIVEPKFFTSRLLMAISKAVENFSLWLHRRAWMCWENVHAASSFVIKTCNYYFQR